MNYKSKYTASEIDARLSQVFDSTLQTKEVEVSEDTTIKADEGFLGLKEVSVKVTGGGGSASSVEYIDVSSLTLEDKGIIVMASSLAKISADLSILPPGLAIAVGDSISAEKIEQVSAVAVDLSVVIYVGGTKMTLMDLLAWSSIPRITEAEFYTL